MTEAQGMGKLELTYTFCPREIKLLARYFRAHQDTIPQGIKDFANSIERTVYNAVSIVEAEQFYS